MDLENFKKFLIKSKINTYALSGEGGEKILSDGSKEFEFKEKSFKYRDRYIGYNSFLGEELVWQNKKAVWGMNYYGTVISEVISTKEIYEFLKEVLKNIPKSRPFRGPNKFKKDNFEYINKSKGTVKKFEGQEIIFYRKKRAYELTYHGGLIVME